MKYSNTLNLVLLKLQNNSLKLKIKPLIKGDFFKLFVTYSFGSLFLYGANFLLMPIYTKVLSKAEFGQIELISTLTAIIGILLTFGLPQLIFVEYFHTEPKQRSKLIFNTVLIYLLLSLPLFCIFLLIIIKNTSFFFKTYVDQDALLMAFIAIFLSFFQSIFISILQVSKQAKKLTLFQISLGILTLALNIYLVYYLRKGIFGYFASTFIVALFSFAYIVYDVMNKIDYAFKFEFRLKFQKIINYLKNGSPFVLGAVSVWILAGADRWIILYYLDDAGVGIYSVAYRFASMYYPLLIIPILNAYTPNLFEKFSNNNFHQNMKKIIISSFLVSLILAFITPLVAQFLIDKSYYASLELMPILVIGYCFFFLTQVIAAIIVFKKKTNVLLQNIFFANIANILLNIFFIRKFGLVGAAVAFSSSQFVWFIATYYRARNLQKALMQ
jgi:O-antigen/teichoic acid export membrane protein